MISHLLDRLGRDLGEARVCGPLQGLQIGVHERRVEQLAHHGDGEVAVRLLDQQHVAVDLLVTQVGELILGATCPARQPSISPA